MKHRIVAMIASAAMASAAVPAMADNLAFNVVQNFTIWAAPGVQALKLNEAGLTVRTFNNPVQGLVSVTYTAECSLEAPPTSWLSISIYIDNVLVPPSGQDLAFCSGWSGGAGRWSSNAVTVAKNLSAGSHTVRVDAFVQNSFSFAFIDDTMLLIER